MVILTKEAKTVNMVKMINVIRVFNFVKMVKMVKTVKMIKMEKESNWPKGLKKTFFLNSKKCQNIQNGKKNGKKLQLVKRSKCSK